MFALICGTKDNIHDFLLDGRHRDIHTLLRGSFVQALLWNEAHTLHDVLLGRRHGDVHNVPLRHCNDAVVVDLGDGHGNVDDMLLDALHTLTPALPRQPRLAAATAMHTVSCSWRQLASHTSHASTLCCRSSVTISRLAQSRKWNHNANSGTLEKNTRRS